MSRDPHTRKSLHRSRPDFDLRHIADHDEGRQSAHDSAGSNTLGESARITTGVPSVTDTLQNSRMDAIERAIRDLTDDMSRNRATFGSLIEELRDVNGNGIPDVLERPSNGYIRGGRDDDLGYLVGRMERNVDGKFKELARAWSVLGDRLKSLEEVVDDIEFDGKPFELTPELEARLKTLSFADDRLDKLEKLLTSLPQRLTEMERRLQTVSTSGGDFNPDVIIGKIDQLERLIMEAPQGNIEIGPVMSSLRDVEAGMRGVGGQLREVDTRTGDFNLLVEAMSEKIEAQEKQIAELSRYVREDLDLTVFSSGSSVDKDAVSSAVGGVVAERFSGLFSQFQHRMAQLEELVKTSIDRPVLVNGSGDVDSGYMNEAVAKIINNQHTLAGSMDEWRTQVREDMSALNARIDGLPVGQGQPAVFPTDTMDEIKNEIRGIRDTIPTVGTVRQPDDGWTRFKNWLYGTPDWYGDSWGVREEGDVWTAPDSQTADRSNGSTNDRHEVYERDVQRGDSGVYERNAYDNQRA